MNQAERPFLSLHEAAQKLQMSVDDCYRMVRSGELPCMRVGRSIRIPSYAIEGLLSAERSPVAGSPVVEPAPNTIDLSDEGDESDAPPPGVSEPTAQTSTQQSPAAPAQPPATPPQVTAQSSASAPIVHKPQSQNGNGKRPAAPPVATAAAPAAQAKKPEPPAPPKVQRADDGTTRVKHGEAEVRPPTVIHPGDQPGGLRGTVSDALKALGRLKPGRLLGRAETAVLSVSDFRINALVVRRSRVTHSGTMALEEGVVRDGAVRDIERFMASVRALEAKLAGPRLGGRPIALIVGGRNLAMGRFQLEPNQEIADSAAMRSLVCERLSVRPEDVVADFASSDWEAQRKTRSKRKRPGQSEKAPALVFGAAVFRSVLDSVLAPVSAAGSQVLNVQPKAIALANAAAVEQGIIVDVEPGNITVIILRGGYVEVVRDASISSELRPSQIADILAGQVNRSVGFYNARYPDDPLPQSSQIFVSTDPSIDRQAVDQALSMLPYARTPIASPFEADETFKSESFAAAIGIARVLSARPKGAAAPAMQFEFLPVEYRPRPFPVKTFAAATASVVLLAGLAPAYLAYDSTSSEVAVQTRTVERLDNQLRLRSIQLKSAALAQEKIAAATKEIERLEASESFIKANDRGFAETLVAIRSAVPIGVTLQEVDDDGLLVLVAAAAPRPDELFTFVRSLSAIEDFTDVRIRTIGLNDTAITATIQITRKGTEKPSVPAPDSQVSGTGS